MFLVRWYNSVAMGIDIPFHENAGRHHKLCIGRVLGLIVLFILPVARASADEFAALHQLGLAEGQEYFAKRDTLLHSNPQRWDVEQACAHSWQAGLAAYILNARLAQPEQFAKWEVEVERGSKMMHLPTPAAGFRRVPVNSAFRLEFAWKPPLWIGDYNWGAEVTGLKGERSPFDAARAEALSTGSPPAPGEPVPVELWRAIWRDCAIERFRAVAIGSLAHSPAEEDRQTVRAVIFDTTSPLDLRAAALNGFLSAAYVAGRPSDTVDVLIQIADNRDTPLQLAKRAVRNLGNTDRWRIEDPRAGAFLRQVARDPMRPEELRCEAINARKSETLPEDVEMLRVALTQTELPQFQRAAVRSDARLRPALKQAMYDYALLDVVSAAARALLKLGTDDDVEFVHAYIDDPEVAEEARSRANGELQSRQELKDFFARREQIRKELLASGKTWAEWQQEEDDRRERAWYKDQREKILSRADPDTGKLSPKDAATLEELVAAERRFEEECKRRRSESKKNSEHVDP